MDTATEIERDVMLQILDQRWRDHLSEMDYLRDGIHLRQVAQQDPLTAWQREGYAMFEQLLDAIDDDYVRYITHVEARRRARRGRRTSRGDLEGQRSPNADADGRAGRRPSCRRTHAPPRQATVVKSERREARPQRAVLVRVGQKFKQCHGRP